MILKFKSNKSVAKPGFKATVTGNEAFNLLGCFCEMLFYILLFVCFSHFPPQQLGKEDGKRKKTRRRSFDDERNLEPCV